MPASRAIWTGAISFGLVNIPVKLFTAVREENVRFHLLHDQDGARLRRKMVCSADGREVHTEHTVRGYELSPDRYVIIRDEELEAIAPRKSKLIEIRDFVDEQKIDPVYYDRPYYLAPQEQGAKAYRLLTDAMVKAGKVGIAQFVMRDKEHLAALRPTGGMLILETMRFGEEVVPPQNVEGLPVKVKTDDRELKMAQQLIDTLATDFKPDKYHDEYRDQVMQLVEKKARGEEVVTQPPQMEAAKPATNLLAALEESLARVKGQQQQGKPRRRKSA